jgi:hypothetical protein
MTNSDTSMYNPNILVEQNNINVNNNTIKRVGILIKN